MCIYYNILLYMWSPPPEPTSQSLLNVNAIYQCQCDTSMSLTSVKIPSKCQRHLPPMSMLHINVINIYQNSKTILWKAKQKETIFWNSLGRAPWRKQKNSRKLKKTTIYWDSWLGSSHPQDLWSFLRFSRCVSVFVCFLGFFWFSI